MKQAINKNQITKVYSGKPGCACGCRGSYSESPRAFSIALKKYENATKVESELAMTSEEESCVFWDSEDGQRTYTIYFKKAV